MNNKNKDDEIKVAEFIMEHDLSICNIRNFISKKNRLETSIWRHVDWSEKDSDIARSLGKTRQAAGLARRMWAPHTLKI